MRLKNKNGDMISIPKDQESKIKSFIERGCNSCVDEYLQKIGHKYKTGNTDLKNIFANGGQVGNNQIEVEGDEVADIPGQGMVKFDGPSHEQGGISTSLPKGTDIYSKRIKVDGKTMAQRKEDREKLEAKILEKLDKNRSDAPLRNTRNRVSDVNMQKDQFDKQIQTEIGEQDQMMEMMAMMAGKGGNPEGMEKAARGKDGELDFSIKERNSPQMEGFQSWVDIMNGKAISGLSGPSISSIHTPTNVLGGYIPSKISDFNHNKYPVPGEDQFYEDHPDLRLKGFTPPELEGFGNSWEDKFGLNNLSPATEEGGGEKGKKRKKGKKGEDSNAAGLPTAGDALKMFGNYMQGRDLERLARESRGGLGNENHFQDFGEDALKTIDEAKDYANQNRDKADRKIEAQRQALTARGRNSSRGVNQMRAMDIASQVRANAGEDDAQSQFANQMMQILSKQSQLENQRDQGQMQGAHAKATEDTQDRDNFFSALSDAKLTQDQALSMTGKDLNEIKGRKVNQNLLNNMLDYGKGSIMTGEYTANDVSDRLKALDSDKKRLQDVKENKFYEDWDYTTKKWDSFSKDKRTEIINKERNK